MVTTQDVIQSVLTKVGLDYLNPSLSSADPQVMEIADLLNETGQDLALRGEWQALLRSDVAGPLPADFGKLSAVTVGDMQARRTLDPAHWAFLTARAVAHPYYRIAAGRVDVLPDDPAVLTYWSAHWADAGEMVRADGDEIFLPMGIMVSGTFYRWLRKKGMPFDDQMAQHEADVAAAQKADRGL